MAQPSRVSIELARRMALHAQGLALPPQPGLTVGEIVRGIGCLQLDPVPAVARSPLLVLNARMRSGASERALDRTAYRDRELFDYWAHEASLCHVDDLALHLWQTRRWRRRPPAAYRDFLQKNAGFAEDLLAELREHGPLRAQDIEEREVSHWEHGYWTPEISWRQTIARMLQCLWFSARIGVHSRDGLTRRWHVLEECLPPGVLDSVEELSDYEATRRAAHRALSMLGVAKPGHIKRHFVRRRYPELDAVLRSDPEIVPVRVEGTNGVWYARAGDLERADSLEAGRRTVALSPFDNLICDRARTAELFDFDHRLEIYVPQEKRVWGYYVLPILHGERFIARADLKIEDGRLRVLSLHHEPGRRAPRAVQRALAQVARWRRVDFEGANEASLVT